MLYVEYRSFYVLPPFAIEYNVFKMGSPKHISHSGHVRPYKGRCPSVVPAHEALRTLVLSKAVIVSAAAMRATASFFKVLTQTQ